MARGIPGGVRGRRGSGRPAAAGTRDPLARVRVGIGILALVLVAGTVGYVILGFGVLDALFQTVVTITTVGFGPDRPLSDGAKVFTMVLILVGVGTALYTFTITLEVLIEGHMRELVRRRRMERDIEHMKEHVIVCGWGRVGRQVVSFLTNSGRPVVVIDRDPERLSTVPFATVQGDVTEDATLMAAGIERAGTLVAALDTDADNLYVTVASRSLQPSIQIIARARSESSEAKLLRAGADRVVNPQRLGGDRIGSFVVQPHVVDFIDVVMHDGSLEFRLEELTVGADSPLSGQTLADADVHSRTGALVLAIRRPDGSFSTNPPPRTRIESGDVLIGVGTSDQLRALGRFAGPT
ncbi:MAG TPA: potassium channel protein [Acidimicrobiales bacterium]|nr:potassium channel protein [Acidimicrobiales bacterium]